MGQSHRRQRGATRLGIRSCALGIGSCRRNWIGMRVFRREISRSKDEESIGPDPRALQESFQFNSEKGKKQVEDQRERRKKKTRTGRVRSKTPSSSGSKETFFSAVEKKGGEQGKKKKSVVGKLCFLAASDPFLLDGGVTVAAALQ